MCFLYVEGLAVPYRQLADLHPDLCRKHMEAAFDLSPPKRKLILVGLFSLTALTDIQLPSPYHPTLALNGGGFPACPAIAESEGGTGSPVAIQTQFGTLSAGLRTPSSAQR